MADSWDAVREEERRSGQTFGSFLFSRTDLVFIRPMGAWAHYVHEPGTPQPWYWHSAGTGTPDILDHVPRRGAPRPRSKLERVPRMHNSRALLQSSNVGVLLVDPSLLVSCEGLLPVRPTPWERDGLGKPESFALSNCAGRETLGTCSARGVRSGFGESESAHAVVSESRSLRL